MFGLPYFSTLGGLHNRNVFLHDFGRWRSQSYDSLVKLFPAFSACHASLGTYLVLLGHAHPYAIPVCMQGSHFHFKPVVLYLTNLTSLNLNSILKSLSSSKVRSMGLKHQQINTGRILLLKRIYVTSLLVVALM